MVNSKGRELLAKYLDDNGLTQVAFVEKVPGGLPNISRILRGERRPDIDSATAIEKATKGAVPATSWAQILKAQRTSSAA